jgi:hypothetical protein
MSQWPGTQNNLNLLLLERSCSDNQHWCRSLNEIVYEVRANNDFIECIVYIKEKIENETFIDY